jgi:hypothetical protein
MHLDHPSDPHCAKTSEKQVGPNDNASGPQQQGENDSDSRLKIGWVNPDKSDCHLRSPELTAPILTPAVVNKRFHKLAPSVRLFRRQRVFRWRIHTPVRQ